MMMMIFFFFLAAVLASDVNSVCAFFVPTTTTIKTTGPFLVTRSPVLSTTSSIKSTAAASDESSQQQTAVTYPRMSREDIEKWLEQIPVYAVTDPKADGGAGVVLLKAKDGSDKAVANFFLSKEMAESTLQQVMAANNGDSQNNLDVTPFSLGMIWFEILNSELAEVSKLAGVEEEVLHRLVPDQTDLMEARRICSKIADEADLKQQKEDLLSKFQSDFDEIPIFMDLQIRMQQEIDGELQDRFPMYLSYQDMTNTCQQFKEVASSSGNSSLPPYEPSVKVTDLKTLVEQMKKQSDVNFRQSLLIPSTEYLQKRSP